MVKRFPAIQFVARWGRTGAPVVSVLAGLVAIICTLQNGSILAAMASVVGAVILWGLLRLGVELIEVISETLLPQ